MVIDFTKFNLIWYTIETKPEGIHVIYWGRLVEEFRLQYGLKHKMQKIFFFTFIDKNYIEQPEELEYFRKNPHEFINAVTNFKNEHGETIE